MKQVDGSKRKRNSIVLIGCFFLSLLVMTFVSADSFLHPLSYRVDSAWFFMAGKSMMNGLIPYVDFADSKGPLLWLIYGLGYLISPRNYVGIYLISVLAYTGIYYFVYRIFLLFRDVIVSTIATLLMTFVFFNPVIHYETRAEDFILVFVFIAVFYTIRCLCLSDDLREKELCRTAIVLGTSMGAVMMIKYNYAAMLSFFCLYLLFDSIRHAVFRKVFFLMFAGFAIVVSPFIIFFLCLGCFDDFLNEYFLNTLLTVDNMTGKGLLSLLFHPFKSFYVIFVIGLFVSVLFSYSYLKRNRWMFVFALFWFLMPLLSLCWAYYLQTYSVFLIWVVLWIVDGLNRAKSLKWVSASLPVFFAVFFFIVSSRIKTDSVVYEVGKAMRHNSTLLFWECMDKGEGTMAHALPACRYWALQNGATDEMKGLQRDCILTGGVDYIIIKSSDDMPEENKAWRLLDESGYTMMLRWKDQSNVNRYLFGKF